MRIFFGYAFITVSAFLILALLSFNPLDSALLTSRVNQPVENIAGMIGVMISSPLVLLYGKYGSLMLGFGLFVVGINILTGSKIGRIFIKATLFIIATISFSVILAAAAAGASYIEAGLLGLAISKSLSEIFSPFVIIGVFSILLLLCLSSAMKLFRNLTWSLARIAGFVILAPFQMFGLLSRGKEEIQDRGDIPVLQEPFNHMAVESLPQAAMEPEFLQKSGGGNASGEVIKRFDMSQSVDAKAPSWLAGRKGSEDVLKDIYRYFDGELEIESAPLPAAGVKAAEPEEGGVIEDTAGIISAEIPMDNMLAEEPPSKPAVKEAIEDLEIEDAGGMDIEEIVGEADYREVAEARIGKDEDADASREIGGRPDYIFPLNSILEKGLETFSRAEENEETERVSKIIENTFASFKIDIRVSGHSRGPAITRYEIVPPTGLKIKNIVNLTDDLALNLGTRNIRIVAPIGNKSIIGVEVPNKFRRTVVLREIIESEEYKKTKAKLPLILGKDIAGNIVIEDLTEMPHLLIAGTTGSGKSVFVNSLIGGITFSRTALEVKFIFIDPKMVELELYNGIPHLLTPVITDPGEAIAVLEWTSSEMDKRYKVLSDYGVRNMQDYNREVKMSGGEYFPYIVIVIDEFANLMLQLPKETEKVISRIAAMARAVGIHLVVATQRPSVDVVTGIIKANFPSRIAFRVSSQTDSRTILDKSGAEKLLGKGDMLFMTPNFTDMLRIQSPYVSNRDVENLVRELLRNGSAEYIIDIEELMSSPVPEADAAFSVNYREDPLFAESLKAAVENGEISASYLQRRFRVGYNRASRLIDAFEKLRILGPSTSSSKPREVLIGLEEMNSILSAK